jgi:hypothetical protein
MRVEVVGHVCIDRNTVEGKEYEGAGSPAMFMGKIFRQLPDCNSGIIAPYGPDFIPYLKGSSLLPVHPLRIQTMVYENIVLGGIRTQKCLYHSQALPVKFDDSIINAIKASDVVCFAPLAPNYSADDIRNIIKYKKVNAPAVLLPQGYFRQFDHKNNNVRVREFIEEGSILPFFNIVIVSDQDHPDMMSQAHDWSVRHGCIVIVTRAEKGAVVMNNTIITEVPTIPVPNSEIVSSIGSGDIFSAGVIYEFTKSNDAVRAAQSGNRLARQCLFCKPDEIVINTV